MRLVFGLFVVIWLIPLTAFSQNSYTFSGKVMNEDNNALPGATVLLDQNGHITVTDQDGMFKITGLREAQYKLEVSFLGYKKYQDTIQVNKNIHLTIQLERAVQTLQEVVVTDHYTERRKRQEALNIEVVNDAFLKQNMGGSLMESLERLPGVSTIGIGSGQAKPVIRGLSFNRVVVTEHGIKHEAQQWGAEHGLEIDQYAIDRVEVIKGPASLTYGSDAIGGIVDIRQFKIPEEQTMGGKIDVTGKSNNAFMGASAHVFARRKSLHISARYTRTDFADYRVPADSVDIYSYRAPLHNNRIRNSAGQEENIHFSAGYSSQDFSSRFYFSNLSSQTGFFANAHGLEPRRVDTELHDHSDRDIQYPFHQVKHLKIINTSEWRKENAHIQAELGFQHNFMQEWSQYVDHGFMPGIFPENMPFPSDLERAFDKYIYSGNLKAGIQFNDRIEAVLGVNVQNQNNSINGRGFIIPAFRQWNTGIFTYGKYLFANNSFLHAGLRYDYGNVDIDRYSDWFPSPVVNETGDTLVRYLERSPQLRRQFNNLTWSFGVNHNLEKVSFKANLGKSFRMPIAKELAANGVNYHRFSYEVGDPDLSPETSYQLDAGAELNIPRFAIGISPFVNYFTNYIYLNPTYRHDRLYGNGNQIFNYTQAEVLRFGGEIHAHYNILKLLTLGLIGEYIYAEQLSGEKKGFTLPFSPPAEILVNLKYTRPDLYFIKNAYLSGDCNIIARQERIVPPEEVTPGYQVFHLSAGGDISAWGQLISVRLQIQNLLNTKYFNHTSYYRLINVPEPGRNFIMNISIPFSGKFKQE